MPKPLSQDFRGLDYFYTLPLGQIQAFLQGEACSSPHACYLSSASGAVKVLFVQHHLGPLRPVPLHEI